MRQYDWSETADWLTQFITQRTFTLGVISPTNSKVASLKVNSFKMATTKISLMTKTNLKKIILVKILLNVFVALI